MVWRVFAVAVAECDGRPDGDTPRLTGDLVTADGSCRLPSVAGPRGETAMLVAASKRGPNLMTRGHDAGLEHIAAPNSRLPHRRISQRRTPLLPAIHCDGLVAAGGNQPCQSERPADRL